MSQPARPIFSFTSWDSDHPGERPPGDRLDAQFAELLRGQALILEQIDAVYRSQQAVEAAARAVSARSVSDSNVLGYGAGGFYATDRDGAEATSADYAQVAIEWAEHMPDTIPPSVLAINAITGDHWSSRWWANRAAQIVSVIGENSIGIVAEQLTVAAPNVFSALSNTPIDTGAGTVVIVNGRTFSGCATPAPFHTAGRTLVWDSTLYSVAVGDEVVIRYRYGTGESPPAPTVGSAAISLYYVASAGQLDFPLSASDHFGRSYLLNPASTVRVTRSGQRLMPDVGAGDGGYRVAGNIVTLLYPAGVGEQIAVDVWESGAPPPDAGWWMSLPTTLPPTPGVLWNNGGVVCVS